VGKRTGIGSGFLSFRWRAISVECFDAVAATYSMRSKLPSQVSFSGIKCVKK